MVTRKVKLIASVNILVRIIDRQSSVFVNVKLNHTGEQTWGYAQVLPMLQVLLLWQGDTVYIRNKDGGKGDWDLYQTHKMGSDRIQAKNKKNSHNSDSFAREES